MFLNEKKLDEQIDEFNKADIEEILESRTEKIVHNQKKRGENLFSEAIFVAEKEDTEVDINDPGFWNHIGLGVEVEKKPDILGRRKRRRPSNHTVGVYPKVSQRKLNNENSDDFVPDADVESSEPEEVGSIDKAVLTHVWGQWKQMSACLTNKQRRRFIKTVSSVEGKDEVGKICYNLLEYVCCEFCALVLQKAVAVAKNRETWLNRNKVILANKEFKASSQKTLLYELKASRAENTDTEEGLKFLQTKIEALDTLSVVENSSSFV